MNVIQVVQFDPKDNKEALVAALNKANEIIGTAISQIEQLQIQAGRFNDQMRELQQASDLRIGELEDKLEQALADKTVMQAAQKKVEHAGKGTHIRVSSAHPAGSHWRGGRLWTREAQDVKVSELSDKQIAAMRDDRNLIVVEL